jgi:transglutaminase/protease-like cytokinesis protein 3
MRQILSLFIILLVIVVNAQQSDFASVDFSRADTNAKRNESASLANLPILAYNLTSNLKTEVEKFRAIYTWVSNNIKADPTQEKIITKKRKYFKNDSLGYIRWNNEFLKINFEKLRKRKKTICTGYAYLIKELCSFVNIECEIINGFGRTVNTNVHKLEFGNHSWNAVKLEGKWYLCDPTWSSGYYDANSIFKSVYNDGYFLADPLLFARNHYPFEKKWLLDSTLLNQPFTLMPLIYNETFKHQIMPLTPETMTVEVKKGAVVTFSFKSLNNQEVTNVALVQFDGALESGFKIFDIKTDGPITSFKKKFKYKGSYDVHLKANNDVIATYVVNVK